MIILDESNLSPLFNGERFFLMVMLNKQFTNLLIFPILPDRRHNTAQNH